MIPYSQIVNVWKYTYAHTPAWSHLHLQSVTDPSFLTHRLYYVDPYNYLMGALLTFTTWDKPVSCKESELAIFDPAPNQTCGEYLQIYQQGMGAATRLLNPANTSGCQVCQYSRGSDFLRTLNIQQEYYAWRNVGIVIGFVLGFYALVYFMMKLRTKATKKAEE